MDEALPAGLEEWRGIGFTAIWSFNTVRTKEHGRGKVPPITGDNDWCYEKWMPGYVTTLRHGHVQTYLLVRLVRAYDHIRG